ncbi:MAG: hypothetical protein F6K28_55770 [Microcoleus sp. SIO2G3]|nr:hypothetical protein [Microcoleus sp. SIO2G3]
MIYPRFLKNLPAPVQMLIRPMWFLSIGLHGLLLLIPIPPQPEPEPASNPKKKAVKVTQLPPPPSPPSPQPSPSLQLPKPSPRMQPTLPPPVKPFPRLRQTPPLIVQRSPRVQPPQPSPVVEQSTPTPTPSTPVTSSAPTPSSTPTPLATPSPSPTPSAEPTPSPSPDEPFADFPHVDGVQPGCNNSLSCWQTTETQWRTVSENLKQNLEAQGYVVKKLELADDTGRTAYQVSKDGETKYYLNLLSTKQGTVYLLTKEQLTPEELNSAVAP